MTCGAFVFVMNWSRPLSRWCSTFYVSKRGVAKPYPLWISFSSHTSSGAMSVPWFCFGGAVSQFVEGKTKSAEKMLRKFVEEMSEKTK